MMYDNGWERFAQTGQIGDYLAYKKETREQVTDNAARDKTGEIRELGYAGFCDCDRYHN